MRLSDKIGPLHHPILKPADLPDFLTVARTHRVLEQLAPFFSGAALPEVFKRDAQIVLGRGPILRQFAPGVDLEGRAMSGHLSLPF